VADGIHYFANYHRMIAGIEALKDAAFQRSQSPRNQGHTSIAGIPFDASEAVLSRCASRALERTASEAVLSRAREAHRESLLGLSQDIDSEELCLQEVVQNSSLMVDAYQHQRRLQ